MVVWCDPGIYSTHYKHPTINTSKILCAQLSDIIARAGVGLSYLIKINSAQLVLNDIQYFLHWVSIQYSSTTSFVTVYTLHSTLLLPGHYPLHLEEKTVVVECLSVLSILSPLYVCLAALQFWIWIIIENQPTNQSQLDSQFEDIQIAPAW